LSSAGCWRSERANMAVSHFEEAADRDRTRQDG
jgi:hypothetical protein